MRQLACLLVAAVPIFLAACGDTPESLNGAGGERRGAASRDGASAINKGKPLPASLRAEAGQMQIATHVDDADATYTVPVDPLITAFDAKLLPIGTNADDWLGWSVAVSGDTALVGAPYYSGVGAAFVFVQNGGVWTQQVVLLAGDGAPDDLFGITVALDGNTAVIGAYLDDDMGPSTGSAYVFERSGGVWTQQAKLLASDGHGADFFGRGLALSGNTAVVGAASHDSNWPTNSNYGAAYVFVRNGTVWSQQAKLLASDPENDDHFGYSVAIDGDTAVVGAYWDDDKGTDSGSAYVFARSGTVWTQQAKLVPSAGAPGDQCGHSVAVSGDTALVGAPLNDANGSNTGATFTFERARPMPCSQQTPNAARPLAGVIRPKFAMA